MESYISIVTDYKTLPVASQLSRYCSLVNKALALPLVFSFLMFCGQSARADSLQYQEWVLIPAGQFVMGTPRDSIDPQKDKSAAYGAVKPWYDDEWPQKRLQLPSFYMDRYEVTNWRYRQYVIETNAPVPVHWVKNGYLLDRQILVIATVEKLRELAANLFHLDIDTRKLDKENLLDLIEKYQVQQHNLPVSNVNWHEAQTFCAWAGGRLPTEQEWEKAARGPEGNNFPWGQQWDETRLNIGENPSWLSGVTPVGAYPAGKSYYDLMNMAGNVMEWTQTDYQAYLGSDYQSEQFKPQNKVVRGGGWGGLGHYVISHLYRAAYRFYLPKDARFNDVGFRCVKDKKNEEKK